MPISPGHSILLWALIATVHTVADWESQLFPFSGGSGRYEEQTVFFFKPPHFPKNNTAFGVMANSKSITVAAIALPIPKFIMLILPDVAFGIALSLPIIFVFSNLQNKSR